MPPLACDSRRLYRVLTYPFVPRVTAVLAVCQEIEFEKSAGKKCFRHANPPTDSSRVFSPRTILLPVAYFEIILIFIMSEVTQILIAMEQGDPQAAEKLLPLVYDELRQLAAQKLAHEKAGQTLQATALVHEAYLRLVDVEKAQQWNNCGHFFAAAAEAMRRILVERARHKKTLKAGGEFQRIELSDVETPDNTFDDLLALHEALEKLEQKDRRKAELVKLRFFAGFTNEQAARALGISTSTADNDWAYARSWLKLEIGHTSPGETA
jgi:RNA polymerase sigma factor (TIGR02999 family)